MSIFFNDRLLRGNRAIKIDADGLAAFDSPNFPALATIGARIDTAGRFLWRPQPVCRLRVHTSLDTRIVCVSLTPGFDDGAISAMIAHCPDLHGLVLRLYGTGNGPAAKAGFLQVLSDAIDRGILVVAATQCPRGAVSLSTYEVGRALLQLGVISAIDMTTEACVNGSYASQLERRCARLKPGYWPSVRAYNTAVQEGWLVIERCVWPAIPFDGICRARFS